jgi:two-component system nitrate/nitrite response regulator NarL
MSLAGVGISGEANVITPTNSLVRQSPGARRAPAPVRVVVFDQSPIFRAGIAHVLQIDSRLDVIGAFDQFEPGLTRECDIVIIDAGMMMNALGAGRSNHAFCVRAKILVLAFILDEVQFASVFAAGARGYLLKRATERELLEAIHAVHRGEGYVSPGVAATILSRRPGQQCAVGLKANPTDQLSHREAEIFKLLPTGLTNREIGQRLGVTENTIKRYFTRIFEKLHVRNRVEAAMLSRLEATTEVVPERKKTISIGSLSLPPPVAALGRKHADSPGTELVANAAAVARGFNVGIRGARPK